MATETGIINIALNHLNVGGRGQRVAEYRQQLVDGLPSILRVVAEQRDWRAFIKQTTLTTPAADNTAPRRYPQEEDYVLLDIPADAVRIVALQNDELVRRQNPEGKVNDMRQQAGRKLRVKKRGKPFVLSYTTQFVVEEMSESLAHYVALELAIYLVGLMEFKDDDFYKVLIGKKEVAERTAINQDRDAHPVAPGLWTSPPMRSAADERRFGGRSGLSTDDFSIYDNCAVRPAEPPDRTDDNRIWNSARAVMGDNRITILNDFAAGQMEARAVAQGQYLDIYRRTCLESVNLHHFFRGGIEKRPGFVPLVGLSADYEEREIVPWKIAEDEEYLILVQRSTERTGINFTFIRVRESGELYTAYSANVDVDLGEGRLANIHFNFVNAGVMICHRDFFPIFIESPEPDNFNIIDPIFVNGPADYLGETGAEVDEEAYDGQVITLTTRWRTRPKDVKDNKADAPTPAEYGSVIYLYKDGWFTSKNIPDGTGQHALPQIRRAGLDTAAGEIWERI